MEVQEIRKYIKGNIQPLCGRLGKEELYRCSATLIDNTFLPCVVIQESEYRLQLALKRFEETRKNKKLHYSAGYESIVRHFVCSGNTVNYYEIKELKPSIYAIPIERMGEIGGETSMGWTEFIVFMDDGSDFCFGTTFEEIFFDMPEGYTADRIKKIIPAVRSEPRKHDKVFREKPFFDCYLDNE